MSSKEFRFMIENLEDMIIHFDTNYKILYANQVYCRLLGKSLEELIGIQLFSPIHPEDLTQRTAILAAMNNKNSTVRYQERVQTESGIKWLEWHTKCRISAQGKLIDYFAAGRDITESKLLEDELLILKERHETAELIGKVGNWEYNIAEDTFWGSEGAKRLYGFPVDKKTITSEEVECRIPDRNRVHKALEDLIENEKPYDLEFEILPEDKPGSLIISSQAVLYRNESGNPEKVIGVIRDITDQKLSEKKLRESEERYRNLIDVATDAIYLINSDGIIEETNEAACDMLGKDKDEIEGRLITEIDQQFSPAKLAYFWKDMEVGITQIFTTRHKHKDGHEIPVEIAGVKFKIDGKYMYYAMVRDISERLAAQEMLRKSEERFKLAVEGSKDGLWDINLLDGEFYYSNRLTHMLGYKPNEFPKTQDGWKELIHPEDKEKVLRKVHDYLSGGLPEYKATFRIYCKDGYYRWITSRGKALWDKTGKPYRFLGFFTDITSRKNAERAFIESEAKYHRLFDTLMEGVIFFNQEGKIIELNPAAENILGYSEQQLKMKSIFDQSWQTERSGGGEYKLEDHPVKKVLETGKSIRNTVVGLYNPQKRSKVWLSVTTVPIFEGDSEKPARAYSIIADITEQLYSETKLRQLNETLLSAQELVHLGCWSYNIAKDEASWSDEMFKILGLKKEKGIPNFDGHKDFIHPASWDKFEQVVQECIKGMPFKIVLKVLFPDQSVHYMLTQGFPRRNPEGEIYELYGTSQDITDLKNTELELQRHKEHLEELVQERTMELEMKNDDLTRYNKLFIGREYRIKELKNEIKIF